MTLALYAHPFSSYCQKALIALDENETNFEYRMLGPENPENYAALVARWPMAKFPMLEDHGTVVVEATIIIDYLSVRYPGPVRLIPDDPEEAIMVRMLDRVFDNYVMTPMNDIVRDGMRPPESKHEQTVADARALLDKSYRWLDGTLVDRPWAAGDHFTLADCAAAPSLFYADWAHPIAAEFGHLRDYRARLLARPSFSRIVDEARPYRPLFPLGAPDRD